MAKIPKGLGDLAALKKREAKSFEDADKWRTILQDAYEYFLPHRNLYEQQEASQRKMDKIFDSTAINAIQEGAGKIQEHIAPIQSRWATAELSEQVKQALEEIDSGVTEEDIRKNLDSNMLSIFSAINASNFPQQFYEMLLEIMVSTGTLRIDEADDDDNPIVFHAIPQIQMAYEEGPGGSVETHWRRLKLKSRAVERTYKGWEISESLREMVKSSPDSEITIHEGVVFEPNIKRYYGVAWVEGDDFLSWVQDYEDSSPWVTGRMSKVAGEVRGRGPALWALPDVRTLNKVQEFALQKAAIDLAGIWTATDDGVFNPYNITIAPGVVIPVGSNNSQNPTIQRLDTSTDLRLTQFEIEALQQNIKKTMFNDLRDPAGPVRSATEISIETRELARRMGSAFGRLQSEILIPILKRVSYILNRRGLTSFKINNRDMKIKFTSPLARAQDMEDLQSVQMAVEFTMATAGPDQAKMAFKLEDFGTWAGKKTGMPTELIRSELEKQQVIQAGAQAAQAQAQGGGNALE